MRISLTILVCILTGALVMGGDGPSQVTYVGHDQVTAALAQGGGLAKGSGYSVGAMHRTAAGAAEMHDKQTDVYYVADGEATFVTGGILLAEKTVAPGQRQGSGIQGGEIHHLTKGDVLVIPPGVPHWFKEVPQSVSYLLMKVEKP